MNRLTERDKCGSADLINLDNKEELYAELKFKNINLLTAALNRLAEYEETGLEPDEIVSLREGLSEQGKLRKATYIKAKICENCGKEFYPNRSDTKYCYNKSPQDETRSCSEYASFKLWYDKLKDNKCMKLCRNIYQAKQMYVRRNPDNKARKDSFERFKIQSQQWKNDVNHGVKTEADFIEWLTGEKGAKP